MFRRRTQRLLHNMGKPGVPPMLQRANQLMASGDYEGAANAFMDLAQRAERRFPQRAPFLFMEAGRAAILSGQAKTGVIHLRRGLTIFASQGRIHRMQAFGQRAIDELKARNLNVEAEEIASLLSGNLPKEIHTEQPAIARRPILPTHCPSCGAAVRSNEIEWLDEVTAECDYCGNPIRSE
ncbi:MAG: hypothetical protein Q7J80_14650 [Anaerolineales bacterium]|nr:hypothetical protein [Anaerolineales bacterium]